MRPMKYLMGDPPEHLKGPDKVSRWSKSLEVIKAGPIHQDGTTDTSSKNDHSKTYKTSRTTLGFLDESFWGLRFAISPCASRSLWVVYK